MRRWSLRILVAVAALIVLAIVTTQVVLSATDVPDRIVLTQVQQQLGLRMTAASVDTGWFGRTTIKDVTLSLPLADESLLSSPTLRVRHTWLAKLLLTRRLVIDRLELEDAKLLVRQDAAGRWNLQDLVELLARTGGKQQAAATSTRRSGPRLPGVVLHGGTVTITDKSGRIATLAPLEFSGLPDEAAPMLVWHYEAKVPQLLSATGQLSPGFQWAHQAQFNVTNAAGVLKPWLGETAGAVNVAGRWEGELKSGNAIGRLTLEKLGAMGLGAAGVVRARLGGGSVLLQPQALIVTTSQKLLPKVEVASGTIEVTAQRITATRLNVAALAGLAQVDGRWSLDQRAGEVTATWDEIAQPGGITHGGRLKAAVTTTLGQPSVTAELVSNGSARGGRWSANVNVTGAGRAWSDMNWSAAAPSLSWKGPPRDVTLDGMVAELVARRTEQSTVLELTSVQMPSAERFAGKGSIDFGTKAWSLNLGGRGWPVPRLPQSTFEFRLAGGGSFSRYNLDDLYLKTGDVEVGGKGFYDRTIPKPLDLDLRIRHQATAATEADPTLRGNLRAEAHVSGTAWPLDVALDGKVLGEALRLKGRHLGDVTIDVAGQLTGDAGHLVSKELELLGGRWALRGNWQKQDNLLRLNVAVRDLPLAQVGEAAGLRDAEGTLAGAWTFDLPDLDRRRLTMAGEFEARAIKVMQFPAERAVGKVALRDGRLDVGPIDLTQGDGTATANVSLAAGALKRPTVALTASQWPVDLPAADAKLSVWADGRLDLDLDSRSATGPLTARADITYGQQPLGQARLAADFSGHAVRFRSIEADAFAGTAAGSGNFDLDNPLAAAGEFTWRDIDGAAIATIWPRLTGLTGRFGGSAKLAPANDPRALEPLRLDVVLDSYGATYRGATLGDGSLTAFMNYEMGEAKKPGVGDRFRIVLADTQDDPSLIRFADGIVRIWARFGRHRGVTTPAGQLSLELDRLDLNQLVHVAAASAEDMPGRLSGTLNAYGTPGDLSRVSGIGSLRLTDSDLVNLDVFRILYEAMNVLEWGKDKREQFLGEGSAGLRFEAGTLYVNDVRYFNRGTEIRAQAVLRDVPRLPDNPIAGTAVGSKRPFYAVKLPFFADADDVLSILQEFATPAVVEGTVREPKVKLVPFAEIGSDMRNLLLGDVHRESRGR